MSNIITVDINEYLSDSEIRDILSNALYDYAYTSFRDSSSIEVLVSNIAYYTIFNKVNDEFDDVDLESLLRDKVKHVIDNLSSYSVFRKKGEYVAVNSVGQDILEDEIRNSRDLIKKKVNEIIDEYPFNEIKRDEIGDVINECIMSKLFGKEEISNRDS